MKTRKTRIIAIALTLAMFVAILPAQALAATLPGYEDAPVLSGITIRPPGILEDDDLTITFTNVRDAIGRADIMTQSQIWFYLEPNGSISFNRDIELTSRLDPDGEHFETILLRAGEVLEIYPLASAMNFYGELMLSFHYGDFPIPPEYTPSGDLEGLYRSYAIVFKVAHYPTHVPILFDWTQRVSDYDVEKTTTASRVLRFEMGHRTFTDNGVPHMLEASPFIVNGRTMVPLRVIVEALGATNLNHNAGVITFVLNGRAITMTVDQPLPNNMGTPVIIAGRTFVPLAYVMGEIGAEARWDSYARAAYIYI